MYPYHTAALAIGDGGKPFPGEFSTNSVELLIGDRRARVFEAGAQLVSILRAYSMLLFMEGFISSQ